MEIIRNNRVLIILAVTITGMIAQINAMNSSCMPLECGSFELTRYTAFRTTPLNHIALSDSDCALESFKQFVSKGANPYTDDDFGMTPLMAVVYNSCEENRRKIANYLVKVKKVSIDQCDRFGNQALHYAVKYDRLQLVELLLSHRAAVNYPNYAGQTPLMMTFEISDPVRQLNMQNLLKRHGAIDPLEPQ